MNEEQKSKKIALFVFESIFFAVCVLCATIFCSTVLNMPTEGVESLSLLAIIPAILLVGVAQIILTIIEIILSTISIKKTSLKVFKTLSKTYLIVSILLIITDIVFFVLVL